MMSVRAGLLAFVVMGLAGAAQAQPVASRPSGEQIYELRCKSCHEPAVERAPGRADLAQRPAADIVRSLTSGAMAPMAQGLSAGEIQSVAAYLTQSARAAAPPAGSAARTDVELPQVAISNANVGTIRRCESNPPIRATPGDWASMGVDDPSSRFQRRPGLKAADVPRLKVKWAFSMTGGGQPTVVGDWLWTTNRSGHFYALDPKTGCVRWVTEGVVARTTPMVFRSAISPSGWVTIVGQNDRHVRAFDAATGQEIWKSPRLEEHMASTLTGTPVVVGDKLIVPISSLEEAVAMSKAYACCTFRGSLAALDLKTGKLLWKTYTVHEPRRNIREKDNGLIVSGPAGAAIWAAPSIDRRRGLTYVVTGDSYTEVDTKGSDAIMAMEIATGRIRWERQVTEGDNFIMGCGRNSTSGNCPSKLGPDYDFGATPVLFTLKGGKQVLVAGQKSGVVHGLDPDTGKVLWQTQVGNGSALGGVEWGIGMDDERVYVPISDLGLLFGEMRGQALSDGQREAKPGLYALDPATGRILWSAPAPKAPCVYAAEARAGRPSMCARAMSAAPAIMPGVVFQGALDGWFRAFDSRTGKILWEHSTTAQTYDTVNGIKGQPGGGIDGMGPTIANGMVFLVSGNNGAARVGSNGVNVLLAYSVDGK